ncbi:unnamed protein product (macronuclear) [Paramecium tetraurelia]|uniref:Uncharacterized protein n=1 Tax=Paramecium tetraurelia TaxID=5888 RepID=A0BNH3_PARTE|nr:uncharacterized protein GSPATT00030728001 [Paramecium tetraurelia]CAK60090.1 unnamed protein product [Paramecium tetraurelia]|eukprot:XP_001427488.1 hypothetical protein (macronuclear) [Paramecium tetraurelia strain d4-2]
MLLVSDYDSVLQTRFGSQFIETKFCLNFRKMNDFDRETFNILRSLVQIPNSFNSVMKWTEIAQEIKTKTKDDLRQMWYKLGFQ